MDPNLKLSKSVGKPLNEDEVASYRRLIGILLYLQISRPDISFTVHRLSQFLQQPTSSHLHLVHQLLRFLKGSHGQGILLKPVTTFHLRAFVDADWGACLDTRRTVSGFCVFFGDSLISWKSKKQTTVARSSAEVEYRALAAVTTELLWIHQLFSDFQVKLLLLAAVFCDNQAAIAIASNPTFHERTKHIEIDCHFVRDKLLDSFLKLLSVRSHSQLADVFTKPLPAAVLNSIMNKLGVINIHTPI